MFKNSDLKKWDKFLDVLPTNEIAALADSNNAIEIVGSRNIKGDSVTKTAEHY